MIEYAALVARVAADGSVAVAVRYGLISEAAPSVTVRVIPFFGLAPAAVEARLAGAPAALTLAATRTQSLSGTVAVPALPAGRVELELRYRVDGAIQRDGGRLDIRVPLLFVEGAPASSQDGFLQTELILPAGLTVTETFPTVPSTRITETASERYTMQLQVIPSMLRWRVTDGAAPWLTFTAAVDAGLLVLLLALGALGVRSLRASA